MARYAQAIPLFGGQHLHTTFLMDLVVVSQISQEHPASPFAPFATDHFLAYYADQTFARHGPHFLFSHSWEGALAATCVLVWVVLKSISESCDLVHFVFVYWHCMLLCS